MMIITKIHVILSVILRCFLYPFSVLPYLYHDFMKCWKRSFFSTSWNRIDGSWPNRRRWPGEISGAHISYDWHFSNGIVPESVMIVNQFFLTDDDQLNPTEWHFSHIIWFVALISVARYDNICSWRDSNLWARISSHLNPQPCFTAKWWVFLLFQIPATKTASTYGTSGEVRTIVPEK